MNAITYWFAEHFSFSRWPAMLTVASGNVQVVILDLDWHRSEESHYYCVTAGLLGLCVNLAFWPRGKWPDDTDRDGA